MTWLDKYKVIRRGLLVFICYEIHWVIHIVFTKPIIIDGHTVTALSIVVGMLATGIGFYKLQRFREDNQPQEKNHHEVFK